MWRNFNSPLWAYLRLFTAILTVLLVPVGWLLKLLGIAGVFLLWTIFDNHKILQDSRKGSPKIHVWFGVPGAGKTTMCAKLAKNANLPVFCNVDVKGTLKLETTDLGEYDMSMDKGAVVLIDEASISGMDNREYKQFTKAEKIYFALHRHMDNEVHVFSQGYDVDKRIRDRACPEGLHILIPTIKGFVCYRNIRRKVGIDKETGDIKDVYNYVGLPHMLYVKDTWGMFDTKDKSKCPERKKEWVKW